MFTNCTNWFFFCLPLLRICRRFNNHIIIIDKWFFFFFLRNVYCLIVPADRFSEMFFRIFNRIVQRLAVVVPLEGLIPVDFNAVKGDKITRTAKIYARGLHDDNTSMLRAELGRYRGNKVIKPIPEPMTAVDLLVRCTNLQTNKLKYFRNYLPRYSSSAPERTLSALDRMDNYLRSTQIYRVG